MADVKKTIEVLFAGKDELGPVLSSIDGKVQGLAAPFAEAAKNILKADAALAALAAGGLVFAFNKSKDLESATVDLQKVLGEYPEQLSAAKDNAIELSNEFGQSATSILASTANFKQAGFDVEEAMILARNAIELVRVGEVDAVLASDLLIASLKGFGEPASEAARLIDILNETSNNYATNVAELGRGMADLSPIASTMGFSMEETAGILTPIIEIFRSGGEAAVALKTGLLRLVDDNPTVVAALDSIGVAQKGANGELRSGKDILADVSGAFGSLEENQKLFVATQLVGIEQAGRLVTVFDNLGKSTEITATAMDASGSRIEELAALMDSSQVSVDRFREGFTNLAAVVGDQFRDAAREVVDGGTEIELALASAVSTGSFDALFDALGGNLDVLSDTLKGIAVAIPKALDDVQFSGLLDSIDAVQQAIGDIFGDIDLTDPEDLTDALQFVVDTLSSLATVTEGMANLLGPVIGNLAEAIDQFNGLPDASKAKLGEDILGVALLVEQAGSAVGLALLGIKNSGAEIETVFEATVGSIGVLWNGVQATIDAIAVGFFGALETLVSAANSLTFGQIKGLRELESDLNALTQGALISLGENLGEAGDNVSRFIDAFDDKEAPGRLAENVARATDSAKSSAEEFAAIEWELDKEGNIAGTVDDIAKSADSVIESMDGAKQSTAEANAAFFELSGTTPELARAMAEMGGTAGPVSEAKKTLEEAAEASDKLLLGLEEIASSERIKTLELTYDLKVANVQAETEQIAAAFATVDGAVASTGDTLSGLAGQLGGLGGSLADLAAQNVIIDQIEAESDLRREAFELEKELTQAQIKQIEARTERLQGDTPTIKVEAEGLEPALEVILWEVLEKIQIRANEDAAEFLLGV